MRAIYRRSGSRVTLVFEARRFRGIGRSPGNTIGVPKASV